MSILRNFARWGKSMTGMRFGKRRCDPHCMAAKLRVTRFEQLEIRNPLTASPTPDIHLGAVYLDPASGNDQSPNVIQVTFQGGSPGTQLNQIIINGDKDHNGKYSSGEILFDTAPGGQGVFGSSPFQIVQANGFTVIGFQVVDGEQQLVINLQGFTAGDKLIFSIDVDEAQFVDPEDGSVDVNAVVEGNEFQRSIMTGSFTAPHFQDTTGSALFWDAYDQNFAAANASSGSTLDLPTDSYQPPSAVDQTDLTAGAVLTLKQTPLPITLSGTVYYDQNLNNHLDAGEQGLGNVKLNLLEWDGSQWLATGNTTTTDAQGNYTFVGLLPGDYRVAEVQPSGYLNVGSQVGTVDGGADGTSVDPDTLSDIQLVGGQDGIHYNFGECLPASVAGKVWADTNGDCVYQPATDIPLAGVQIDLLDSQGHFIRSTTTNAQGQYEFDDLAPGTYGVFEHQPAGYFQGMDMVGSVGGLNSATDTITQVALGSDVHGVNYDFCEELPASLSGKVWADTNGDCVYQPQTDIPLSGVQIDLLDSEGHTVATTTTNAQGQYKFENLAPGTYSVFEHQPAGYFEGMDMVGTVAGEIDGTHGGTDLLSHITLGSGANGINYDFCEELPASLSGKVWADPQGDCVFGPQDIPLAGVQIDLLNAQGQVVATTTTNAQGQYKFDNLAPGTYGVFEHQPTGYFEGMDLLGTVGGVIVGAHGGTDLLNQIALGSGANGVEYDFCEELPASLSGKVWNDTNGDCIYQPTDLPLSGVQIDLLNSQGQVVATTTTDVSGNYKFEGLAPGEYQVFEHQPQGYLEDMDMLGTVAGVIVGSHGGADLLSQITLGSGANGINYDFCEELPASLSGKVWNDTNGDCIYEPETDIPLSGVQIDLLDNQGRVVVTTTTDAGGNYKFKNLTPGNYSVFEHQPVGFLEGMDLLGTVGGATVGTHGGTDLLGQIALGTGAAGINYDFCEELPASLSGIVWNDTNGDCIYEPETDIPLSGVQIDLLNAGGHVVATTTTDANGNYKFENLVPGTYNVFEHQPTGFLEGMDMVGTVGGVTVGSHGATDLLSQIVLGPGAAGIDYDFCEELPASLSGKVWNDTNGDCVFKSETDIPLSGVQIDLLNAGGHVIATTKTDAQGNYEFENLVPGTYSVFEHQPSGFLEGMDILGTVGGITIGTHSGTDLLSQIILGPGAEGIHYDFCEELPASLSGYVFQDGPPIVLLPGQTLLDVETIRDGKRTPNDKPIAGVTLLLYDGTGNPILDSQGHQLTAKTNAAGFYQFTGLRAGTYLVRELQPGGFIDGIDTPGTTGGVADNHNTPPTAIPPLSFDPNFDVIASITLGVGQDSLENNFSEVTVQRVPFIPPPSNPLVSPPPLAGPSIPILPALFIPPYTPLPYRPDIAGADALGYTWHLSIVDAGYPRGEVTQFVAVSAASASAPKIDWSSIQMTAAEWIFIDANGHEVHRKTIGIKNAIPVAGDFKGNGFWELGLYVDGQWFIDLDGNGQWDAGDLWAKLGTRDDQPVVGDWDGDGKADIGIFGPAWPRDPHAVQADPGLPDPMNKITGKRKKNIPPKEEDAAIGHRRMQLGPQGKMREELIDHVFHYGTAVERAVVGDWTGSGLRRIGVFRDGNWYLDMNGDGRWGTEDIDCHFGQAGDIPVVGDWTGDGIEKIGVYRNGTWYLDTNNNHQLDAGDRVVHLGQGGDLPVVGDFNGEGRASIGVYRPNGASSSDASVAEVPVETPVVTK